MDGTLAVIIVIASLTDMARNECQTGCLAEKDADARAAVQLSSLIFQEEAIGQEIYATFDSGRRFGPFQPTYGVSASSEGDYWIGAGYKWIYQPQSMGDFFIEGYLMPGLYSQGDGPDLGHPLEFRSSIGLGYEFDGGATLTVLLDHRSNADIVETNPGVETLGVRFAMPLE